MGTNQLCTTVDARWSMGRLPIDETWIHQEDSPLFKVIPRDDRVLAEIELPRLDTNGRQEIREVFTYPACWLVLHALSRMVDAEEELYDPGHPNQDQHSKKLRTEWFLALLELAHLYRFFGAYIHRPLAPGVNCHFAAIKNVATVAHEHTPALEQLGQPDLFHRVLRSLKQRRDRGPTELEVKEPILHGSRADCATALSRFLCEECKIDPLSETHSARNHAITIADQAALALSFFAKQVSCP